MTKSTNPYNDHLADLQRIYHEFVEANYFWNPGDGSAGVAVDTAKRAMEHIIADFFVNLMRGTSNARIDKRLAGPCSQRATEVAPANSSSVNAADARTDSPNVVGARALSGDQSKCGEPTCPYCHPPKETNQ